MGNQQPAVRKKRRSKTLIKTNLQLSILALPAFLLLLVFSYLPMGGLVLAFKKYNVVDGIFGSPWCGWANFEFFFSSQDAARVLRNTLLLNAMFITVSTILAVIFALMLFEIKKRWVVKTFQTIFVIPSLVSWVVVGYISYAILQPQNGLLNNVLGMLGIQPIMWYSMPQYWPWILLFFSLWKGLGMSLLYYYAALMGVDESMFEAAKLDGANRLQMSWYISLPFLVPTIIILTILHIGNIFRADFGLFYNITQDIGALYPTTDVIDTYIYRALSQIGDIGMSTAVGFFQSIVGFVMIYLTNFIVNKIDSDKALF